MRNLKYISGMNIRISHEVKGAADRLLPWVYGGGKAYEHPDPLSAGLWKNHDSPGSGAAGIGRKPFSGHGRTVGVVDERSEIAGTFRGMAQNDVGMRTDVLDGCPKAEGMMLLLRSMAPEIIAVDELGGEGRDPFRQTGP